MHLSECHGPPTWKLLLHKLARVVGVCRKVPGDKGISFTCTSTGLRTSGKRREELYEKSFNHVVIAAWLNAL